MHNFNLNLDLYNMSRYHNVHVPSPSPCRSSIFSRIICKPVAGARPPAIAFFISAPAPTTHALRRKTAAATFSVKCQKKGLAV